MKVPKWLIIAALAIAGLLWWYQGGNVPDSLPDWLRLSTPTSDSDVAEYRLTGGFPAAATLAVFKKLASLSQGNQVEAIEELKFQGLVWETTEGQEVRVLNRQRSSRLVEVQNLGTFESYWTYADALEK